MTVGKAVGVSSAMDMLTFIASVVGSVAWPLAAFAIALLFRAQLRRLLDRIRRLSLGENSVDFAEKLDEAEAVADAATVLPESAAEISDYSVPDARTAQLIALSPAAAVLDTWRSVERDVKLKAENLISLPSSKTVRMMTFRHATKALLDAGNITGSTYSLLYDLQQLRNAAAHTDSVTAADAVRFTSLAKQALLFLSGPDVRPDVPNNI